METMKCVVMAVSTFLYNGGRLDDWIVNDAVRSARESGADMVVL